LKRSFPPLLAYRDALQPVEPPKIVRLEADNLRVVVDYSKEYALADGYQCWYCNLPLEGYVWAVPLKKRVEVRYRTFVTDEKLVQIYRTQQSNHQGYALEGAFCCPSCVQAYIEECSQEDLVRYRESRALLLDWTGLAKIVRSPSRLLLKSFFGPLSPKEYRQQSPPTEHGGWSASPDKKTIECRHSDMNVPLTLVFCTS